MSKQVRGFTLIELMIVVAVIAVLATLALSQYTKQVRKAKRAEAKGVLADFVMRQEKYRSNHALYATCDQLLAPTTTCALFNSANISKNYTFAVAGAAAAPTASTYTMTATPKTADQLKDTCGTLQVALALGVVDKSPSTPGCWQ